MKPIKKKDPKIHLCISFQGRITGKTADGRPVEIVLDSASKRLVRERLTKRSYIEKNRKYRRRGL